MTPKTPRKEPKPKKPESAPSINEGRNRNGSFALGNEFWKHTTKLGRDKLFSSPEDLREEAYAHFQWVHDNPIIETKPMLEGKKIVNIEVPHLRAMTMKGLCIYLKVSEHYFQQFKKEQKEKPESAEFLGVIAEIEDIVFQQKFTGAAAGLLNANIISRDLGMMDKIDHSNAGQPFQSLPPIINVYEGNAPELSDDESKIRE